MIRFFSFKFLIFDASIGEENPCNTTKYESIDADSGCTEYFNRFFLATILAFQKASTFFHMNIIMHFKELFFPLPKMQFRKKISCFNNTYI